MKVQFRSRRRERNEDGAAETVVYFGSRGEIEEFYESLEPGKAVDGLPGTLDSAEMSQESPAIWLLTVHCTSGGDDAIEMPAKAWGAKTCTLNAGMLSIPLENHEDYLPCWNHYLFAAPGAGDPGWFESRETTALSDAEAEQYAWGSTLSDAPVVEGKRWKCVGEPVKPGVTSYDVATYQITEVARYRSMKQAGQAVQGRINAICPPSYDFGISGGDWKCDGASVSYNGRYWLGTLTYTRSGDDSGWDSDLYK